MAENWTFRDFQVGNARWTAGNGNKVEVAPAMMNGVDAAFLVVEHLAEWNKGSTDWLDPVRDMYAGISDDDCADRYRNDKDFLYNSMIAWGQGDCMRWALF